MAKSKKTPKTTPTTSTPRELLDVDAASFKTTSRDLGKPTRRAGSEPAGEWRFVSAARPGDMTFDRAQQGPDPQRQPSSRTPYRRGV